MFIEIEIRIFFHSNEIKLISHSRGQFQFFFHVEKVYTIFKNYFLID